MLGWNIKHVLFGQMYSGGGCALITYKLIIYPGTVLSMFFRFPFKIKMDKWDSASPVFLQSSGWSGGGGILCLEKWHFLLLSR